MINYRRASENDSLLLWEWRNDAQTRANSLTSDIVPLPKHAEWFRASLQSSKRSIYIAEIDNKPIGMLRTDQVQDALYELSWTVAPEFRGQGLGKKMLSDFVRSSPLNFCARIKRDNQGSIRMSEHAGFVLVRCDGDVLYMERSPDSHASTVP